MLSPQSLDVALQLRTKGTIVIETRDTTIDLKGGHIEEFLTQQVLALLPFVLFGKIFSSCNTGTTLVNTLGLYLFM